MYTRTKRILDREKKYKREKRMLKPRYCSQGPAPIHAGVVDTYLYNERVRKGESLGEGEKG